MDALAWRGFTSTRVIAKMTGYGRRLDGASKFILCLCRSMRSDKSDCIGDKRRTRPRFPTQEHYLSPCANEDTNHDMSQQIYVRENQFCVIRRKSCYLSVRCPYSSRHSR